SGLAKGLVGIVGHSVEVLHGICAGLVLGYTGTRRVGVARPMTDAGVVVLGIPIPSSSPLFLSIVAVHVAAGITCTVAGIVAMLAPKRSGRHPSAGTVYYWSLVVVFLSMAALYILRWPANTHLFILGVLSYGAGVAGRMAQRRSPRQLS